MRTNPFSDAIGFLTQPNWTTLFFWLLLIASIAIAAFNLRRDETQRAEVHLWQWLLRVLIGSMWWVQSLWKMPPTFTDRADGTGGLMFWVNEMAKHAAFEVQADFVKNVFQPNFFFFALQVYLIEVFIAVSLILGLFSRLGGFLGVLMGINLWLGLYRHPAEWPWNYIFLIVVHAMFTIHVVGRSLGVDAMLVRRPAPGGGEGWGSRVLRYVS
jgi:uncharacterized membrane protein YphA (DoxX/SURF4 family)